MNKFELLFTIFLYCISFSNSLTTFFLILLMASANTTPLVELSTAITLLIKLSSKNHHIWCTQITHLLQAHDLYRYVTRDISCPPLTVGDGDIAIVNPTYNRWKCQDHYVFLTLLGSCGSDTQIVMTSATSSTTYWTRLNKHYANQSRTLMTMILLLLLLMA